jgi:hypothetical protein
VRRFAGSAWRQQEIEIAHLACERAPAFAREYARGIVRGARQLPACIEASQQRIADLAAVIQASCERTRASGHDLS